LVDLVLYHSLSSRTFLRPNRVPPSLRFDAEGDTTPQKHDRGPDYRDIRKRHLVAQMVCFGYVDWYAFAIPNRIVASGKADAIGNRELDLQLRPRSVFFRGIL